MDYPPGKNEKEEKSKDKKPLWKRATLGVLGGLALSIPSKANKGIEEGTGPTDSLKAKIESKINNSIGGDKDPSGKLEDKNYRMDTMQVTEKNGQQFLLIKLTKTKGEYSSYQEVIEAVQKINPDIRLLTPEETRDLLSENKNVVSKKRYYVSLGRDATGSPVDIKASSGSGIQFNAYTFDKNGNILVAGSSSPADNDYLFPGSMKSKNTDASYLAQNKK